MKERLSDLLSRGGYHSYAYSYPHKTAYRTLPQSLSLRDLWSTENRSALFLYLHVPFCEQRCGFCNLFTQVMPKADVVTRYLDTIDRQAQVMHDVLEPYRFAQLAIGGGTPTYLDAQQLARLFATVRRLAPQVIPTSIETSPATLDADKVSLLRAEGVSRISMGVQSIFSHETSAVQRRQQLADVDRALSLFYDAIPIRNIDLIYGLPNQTEASLRESISYVVSRGANELYLYPLYVRPLTILSRHETHQDHRVSLYRDARKHLLTLGFRQVSMRMFTRVAPQAQTDDAPRYRCQEDGMVGIGPGARSYTHKLHYAAPFAVGQAAIRDRIETWLSQSNEDFSVARHGFLLGPKEQQRRYLLLSLLEGQVCRPSYVKRFGKDVLLHFPELSEAVAAGLVCDTPSALLLTEQGQQYADVLGHWLQSEEVLAARSSWDAA